MENETYYEEAQVEQKSPLHQVTPLSKYLALALFIILPFIGGWIGYTYAPEKVVEVEIVTVKEGDVEKIANEGNPTKNPDLVVYPKDSSQITEVIIEGSVIYAKFEDLVKVRNNSPEWQSMLVSNPEEITYLGYGIFRDGQELRTIKHGATLPESEFIKLDPSENVKIVPLDDDFAALIMNGNKLFLHGIAGYSNFPQLVEIPLVNIDEVESLGGSRYSIGQDIYLFGMDVNTPSFKIIE